MALDVEGVVDGSVCGKEISGRTRALEPLHLALPPSRRLMRILSSIVLPSPTLMVAFDPKIPDRGAVWSQVVGDQSLRNKGILPQELAHQFQRGVLVSLGLDQHVEDLALSVDGPPKVDHSAVDFQIDLVEMPSRMRLQATLSQVGRDQWSEMVPPTPNGLVRHRHSALRQQILDVTQAEGEPEVEPYCLVNDLRRETISAVADFRHAHRTTALSKIEQTDAGVTKPPCRLDPPLPAWTPLCRGRSGPPRSRRHGAPQPTCSRDRDRSVRAQPSSRGLQRRSPPPRPPRPPPQSPRSARPRGRGAFPRRRPTKQVPALPSSAPLRPPALRLAVQARSARRLIASEGHERRGQPPKEASP